MLMLIRPDHQLPNGDDLLQPFIAVGSKDKIYCFQLCSLFWTTDEASVFYLVESVGSGESL